VFCSGMEFCPLPREDKNILIILKIFVANALVFKPTLSFIRLVIYHEEGMVIKVNTVQ